MGSSASTKLKINMGFTFTSFNRIDLPRQHGQGKASPPTKCVYVKQRYQICGHVKINCKHADQHLLDKLHLAPNLPCQHFYLIKVLTKPGRKAFADPNYIYTIGTSKLIAMAKLHECIHFERKYLNI